MIIVLLKDFACYMKWRGISECKLVINFSIKELIVFLDDINC